MGLIDDLAPDAESVLTAARAWIEANPRAKQPWDRSGFRFKGPQPQSIEAMHLYVAAAAMLYSKTTGVMKGPEAALRAVQEGCRMTIEGGLELETQLFCQIVVSDQAKDMVRTLWFHRTAAEKQEGLPHVDDDGFQKIAIIGAGMMGASLAFVCAYRAASRT